MRTYHTLCVSISCAALWFFIGALLDCGDTWLVTLWVCAIDSPDVSKSSLAGYHCGTPFVENDHFSWLWLANTVITAQECGSCVVYWVTVASADLFCVSNSNSFLELSNFRIIFLRLGPLMADLVGSWAILSSTLHKFVILVPQSVLMLQSGS